MKWIANPSLAGKRFRLAILGACLFLTGAASALDFNDLQNLLHNQVPENVIINMVQQDQNLTITQEQANQLRALGASESLVYSIRPSATTYVQAPVVTGTTATGYPADGGVYATGSYSDYDAYDNDYDDFESEYYPQTGSYGTSPSTVVQTVPSYGATPGYVDSGSTIYYQQQPQVIMQPAPTIVYDTSPTYVYPRGPAYDYGVYFGSGRYGHRRPSPPPSHRPRPPAFRPPSRPTPQPSHRPSPPHSSRPGGKPDGKPGGKPDGKPDGKPGGRPDGRPPRPSHR